MENEAQTPNPQLGLKKAASRSEFDRIFTMPSFPIDEFGSPSLPKAFKIVVFDPLAGKAVSRVNIDRISHSYD